MEGFFHIDIGQVIIAVFLLLITLIGKLIKNEVNSLVKRLDNHEHVIKSLGDNLAKCIGQVELLAKLVLNNQRHIRRSDFIE